MADQQGQSPPNWFERHPKKTIFGLVVILMLAATYGAEKLLAYINHTHNLVLFYREALHQFKGDPALNRHGGCPPG